MAQSQNTSVELQTTGVSYMGFGGKVGKFLIGDKALEFYPDSNVERYIQIPWDSIQTIGTNVHQKKLVGILKFIQRKVDSCLHLKILVRFLKLPASISAMIKL